MAKKSLLNMHNLIFVGMVAGVLGGVSLWNVEDKTGPGYDSTIWWLDLCGKTLFIGALKMIIAPLILTSIFAGVTSLPDASQLGRIGWKTFAYYFSTTTIAVLIGIGFVLTLRPGHSPASLAIREARATELTARRAAYLAETGKNPEGSLGERTAYLEWLTAKEGASHASGAEGARFQKVASAGARKPRDIFKQDIIEPILTNPFEALATRSSLGIIFFTLLMGIACIYVGEPARPLVAVMHAANAVVMKITTWIMTISPIAIACLMSSLVATHGPEVFKSLGSYCITVIGGILVHVGVLFLIAHYVGRVSPRRLILAVRDALLIAFSTRSSAATLPVTVKCVTENLKIKPQVADFALPLGATINMDGTALYEGVAIIYLLQIYGGMDDVTTTIGGITTLLIFITAVLASVGAAAVPDAGLVTMVLVATAVRLPVYYIPLIFAVDAFLDMFRTSTNVLGDIVGCTVVERFEGARLSAETAHGLGTA